MTSSEIFRTRWATSRNEIFKNMSQKQTEWPIEDNKTLSALLIYLPKLPCVILAVVVTEKLYSFVDYFMENLFFQRTLAIAESVCLD